MFDYCMKVLGYSEGAAYLRIYAGRLSLQYPEILELLRTRRVHLTAIRTVGPHLKPSNSSELLSRASAKTERELKFLIAASAPQPERLEVLRRLSAPESARPETSSEPVAEPAPTSPALISEPLIKPAPPPKARIEPISADRARFGFTGTVEFLKKFERARELLRHRYPAGAAEDVFNAVIEVFLEARDPARKSKPARRASNPRSRRIASWIKSEVFRRDGGRCAYVSADDVRCDERGGLEYDHIVPWAKGGPSNDPANIRLLCRTHNAYEAAVAFGSAAARHRKRGPYVSPAGALSAWRDARGRTLQHESRQEAGRGDIARGAHEGGA